VKIFTRRRAIIVGVLGAGSSVSAGGSPMSAIGCGRTLFNVKPGEAGLSGWVKIARDNSVIWPCRAEMGRSIPRSPCWSPRRWTRWDQIRVEDPPEDGVSPTSIS
jgi:isoquinoline 1-oxidoreductase beta subunit